MSVNSTLINNKNAICNSFKQILKILIQKFYNYIKNIQIQ